ncbi:hypothetical protein VNI00_012236 [Paramarasmius palmivorus]|uniref:Uncharacterized protein n=1 Tax=Paramarasmius palmivorus TaxID=297713 RepID=A0AAW0C646_9AGAR
MDKSSASDLWLERSRLSGMILAAFIFGIYFVLTIEACISLYRNNRSKSGRALGNTTSYILLSYVITTFILFAMTTAANARYTEDIWINLRAHKSPEELIMNEFDYWYNRMAVVTSFVQIWMMDFLLLYRCFIIWNFNPWVVVLMSAAYGTIIGLSTAVMVYVNKEVVFFNIRVQLAFLIVSCAFNIIYTFLVTLRLISIRKCISQVMGQEYAAMYTNMTAMLIESAALYFVFDVVYVFAFGFHSDVQNLILLGYSGIQVCKFLSAKCESLLTGRLGHWQGIALLLIIVRVAKGRDYDSRRTRAAQPSGSTSSRVEFTTCPPMSLVTGPIMSTGDVDVESSTPRKESD